MESLPAHFRSVLMGTDTSKPNKLWLAIAWKSKYYLEYKWQSEPLRSRLMFKFEVNEQFKEAKSFEEDIHSKMKSHKE